MTLSKHKEFLDQTGFLKGFKLKGLSNEEFAIVDKYGSWFLSLEQGRIVPETEEQDRFLLVCRNEQEAATLYEKAWINYKSIIDLDHLLTGEIVEPILEGKSEVLKTLKDRNLPEFAFDNMVFRLRLEEERSDTTQKRVALQEAVIKIRRIGRKGSANRYSHTNYGGLHNYGL